MLPLLNTQGAQYTEARGINPPMIRAMCHIGYAVAVANLTPNEEWESTFRVMVRDEVEEAKRHIQQQNNDGFSSNPFISSTAAAKLNEILDQFDEALGALNEWSKEQTYEGMTTLGTNLAYISALAEQFVTGDGADEGRNP